MRILLLTQYYAPEPPKLLSELTTGLKEQGHEVTVLTGFPNFPSGKIYPGYRIRWYQRETLEGIPVIRVPVFPDHSRSAPRRALNVLSFAFFAALWGPWLVPQVDVIYVIQPPMSAIPAWILSRLRGIAFTYEIQDMWPEVLSATGILNKAWALGLIRWFTKKVYVKASAIRVISEGFRQNLIEKGVPDQKIHVISNWVDTDWYRPLHADQELAQEHHLAGRFNVMFAGMMGPFQALDVVLDAASLLRDLPDVQFVLIGDGNDLSRLRRAADDRDLSNVRFLGRHPMEKMPDFYAIADVLLVHTKDHPVCRITIPHKTFTYMASGKPILAAAAGDVARVVESSGAGVVCAPEDPQALADSVRRLYEMSAEQRRSIGDAARARACDEFSRAKCIRDISHMIEESAETRTPYKQATARVKDRRDDDTSEIRPAPQKA